MGSKRIRRHLPEARSFIDGWGLAMRYKNPDEWQTQLIAGMEHGVVWTTQYPWLEPDPYHEPMDYFRGQPWMYWEIDSFGGRDYLHSFVPYQRVLDIARDILSRPTSNCIGYGTQPEVIGYDPFVRYLYMKLAWDPMRYSDIAGVLSDYVARRFSAQSYETMFQSKALVVDCLSRSIPGTSPPYAGSDGAIYREARQVNYSAVAAGWPLYTRLQDPEQLREALVLALRCQQDERGNVLYVNDLSRLFHSYAAKLFAFVTVVLFGIRTGDGRISTGERPRTGAKVLETIRRKCGCDVEHSGTPRRGLADAAGAVNGSYDQSSDFCSWHVASSFERYKRPLRWLF